MAADWSSLPSDLVRKISNKLPAIEDFVVLTAVCRSYRSATDRKLWRPDGDSLPPWLLLCCRHQEGDDCGEDNPPASERAFLTTYNKNKNKIVMNLPELYGRRCWGSPYGWIVTLGLDRQLHLFNPLNRRRILLPQTVRQKEDLPLDWTESQKSHWMRQMHINRAILIKRPLSSSSSSEFNEFLVVTTGHLSEFHVIRPHSWAPVKFYYLGPNSSAPGFIFDIACYNGQIYMLGIRGRLFICSNFDGPDPPITEEYVGMDTNLLEGSEKLYLVNWFGELLMIVRIVDYYDEDDEDYSEGQPFYNTAAFEAYKFNFATKKWIEVEDLGDCALFVGNCQSIFLPQPEAVGYRKNSIYFTDDSYEQFVGKDVAGGHDMGIYDFDKMTIQSLYNGDDSLSTYSTPTWFLPSFI